MVPHPVRVLRNTAIFVYYGALTDRTVIAAVPDLLYVCVCVCVCVFIISTGVKLNVNVNVL